MGLTLLLTSLLAATGSLALRTPPFQSLAQLQQQARDEPSPGQPSFQRPLVGILAQACHQCPGKAYVAAAYVKWIEQAGGRAVPIRFYVSDDELHRLYKSVNGLILPGGLTDLWLDDPYVVAARKLIAWAEEDNRAGDVFPVWGTCLGHQLLQILSANASFEDLLVKTDAVSMPTTLNFTEAARSSKTFRTMYENRADLVSKLADPRQNISMENHEFGLPPAHYSGKFSVLSETFDILTTTVDRNGVEYVSTIEHKWYPFFGTQWHPEKPPFEFSDTTIPHTHSAISVSQHLANLFVDYSRQSAHRPESKEEEMAMLIYNHQAVFTALEVTFASSYDGPDITYFLDEDLIDPSEERDTPERDALRRPALLTKFN